MEVEPRYSVAEIYDLTANKFGCTVQQLQGKAQSSGDPLNTARNVAAMVAMVAGHPRNLVAAFAKRSESVLHNLTSRTYDQPAERARLAWGVWHELGGTWDAFELCLTLAPPAPVGSAPTHIEIYTIPTDDEYLIKGVSRPGASDKPTPILKYFTRNMDISPGLLRHLGLGAHQCGEAQLYANLLKTAITDYLLGEDAKSWLMSEEQSNQDGISFSDACTLLRIEPAALRSKLNRIASLIEATREKAE